MTSTSGPFLHVAALSELSLLTRAGGQEATASDWLLSVEAVNTKHSKVDTIGLKTKIVGDSFPLWYVTASQLAAAFSTTTRT